jgi:hypothetical protein
MAIVNNLWLKGSSKKLAGTVIYQVNGQTRQRELAAKVNNPRTTSQQTQRVKWANLVNFYRANRSWMKYAYESKKPTQSEYNKLMSLNVTNSPIYLTKQAAASGACVVAPYIMTQGSLPSIQLTNSNAGLLTNLFLPAGFSITPLTTIGEITNALLEANPSLQAGDQLSFVRYIQLVNETTGYPYVIVRKYEVLLLRNSVDIFGNYMPLDLFGVQNVDGGDVISVSNGGEIGGVMLVHSRTISGKTYVSTQSIVLVNNEAIYDQYSGQAALDAAILSYGSEEDAFLSTDEANFAENQQISLVPLAAVINGVSYPARSYVGRMAQVEGKRLEVEFNGGVAFTAPSVYVDTTQQSNGTAQQSNITVTGNRVIVPVVSAGSVNDDAIIRAIRVVESGKEYQITFIQTPITNIE